MHALQRKALRRAFASTNCCSLQTRIPPRRARITSLQHPCRVALPSAEYIFFSFPAACRGGGGGATADRTREKETERQTGRTYSVGLPGPAAAGAVQPSCRRAPERIIIRYKQTKVERGVHVCVYGGGLFCTCRVVHGFGGNYQGGVERGSRRISGAAVRKRISKSCSADGGHRSPGIPDGSLLHQLVPDCCMRPRLTCRPPRGPRP